MIEPILIAPARRRAALGLALALLLAALPGAVQAKPTKPVVSNVVSKFSSALFIGDTAVALVGALHVNLRFIPTNPLRLSVNLVGLKGESVATPQDPYRQAGPTSFTVEGVAAPGGSFNLHVFYFLLPPNPILPPSPIRSGILVRTTFRLTLDARGAISAIDELGSVEAEG